MHDPDFDADGGFAEFLDDSGGDLDAAEDYVRECEQMMADPVVREAYGETRALKALTGEEAAKLSPEGQRYWFERRVFLASIFGAQTDHIPSDPSAMGRAEMLAAIGEHPAMFAPKDDMQDGRRRVN